MDDVDTKRFYRSSTFWSFFIAITGIGVSLFLYFLSIKKPEPVYIVKKEPSIIYDKTHVGSRISLQVNGKTVVNENVYITTLVLWNKGRKTIETSDVGRKFYVKGNGNTEILDIKITKQKLEGIAGFKLIKSGNAYQINWDRFESGFGVEIQIVYSGDVNSKVFIDGYVTGSFVKELSNEKPSGYLNLLVKLFLSLFLLFCGLGLINITAYRKMIFKDEGHRKLLGRLLSVPVFLACLAILIYIVALLYNIYLNVSYYEPF